MGNPRKYRGGWQPIKRPQYSLKTNTLLTLHTNFGFPRFCLFKLEASTGTDRQTDKRARCVMWSIERQNNKITELQAA